MSSGARSLFPASGQRNCARHRFRLDVVEMFGARAEPFHPEQAGSVLARDYEENQRPSHLTISSQQCLHR
jgi:hypothetical protein